MKVTDIEVHEITLPYQNWIAYQLNHYGGPTRRTIYVVHTDTGLIGLGDGGRIVFIHWRHNSADVGNDRRIPDSSY